MYKINLHAHTHNSDGRDSIRGMCEKALELGFCACVITDHDDIRNFAYHKNQAEVNVLKKMNALPLPVILGSEIYTPMGEYLLFGNKAILRWHENRQRFTELANTYDINLFIHMFKTYVLQKNIFNITHGKTFITESIQTDYALIKCHPDQPSDLVRDIPKEWWDLVHGIEIQNGLHDYNTDKEDKIKDMIKAYQEVIPGCGLFRNSDAHTAGQLEECWNEVPKKIENGEQLISYIRSFRKNYNEEYLLNS